MLPILLTVAFLLYLIRRSRAGDASSPHCLLQVLHSAFSTSCSFDALRSSLDTLPQHPTADLADSSANSTAEHISADDLPRGRLTVRDALTLGNSF